MTLATPAAVLALLLPVRLRLTGEQFMAVCQVNPNAVLELDASGQLIHMTPTGSETGSRNEALGALLLIAVCASRLPLKLFASSTGFRLPDRSVLSPDASLVRLERWQALTPKERRGFAPLCPADLVVELASASGDGPRGLTVLRRKMAANQANGAQLCWQLIPEQKAVEVCLPAVPASRARGLPTLMPPPASMPPRCSPGYELSCRRSGRAEPAAMQVVNERIRCDMRTRRSHASDRLTTRPSALPRVSGQSAIGQRDPHAPAVPGVMFKSPSRCLMATSQMLATDITHA
jgi:Uma2 family endonuclease